MKSVDIRHGDSREVLKGLADNSVDSVVCDPPYALVSIVKRFGGKNAAAAKSEGASGVYKRASAGFMGKTWDTGETAFAVEFWEEVKRVLKPGGHVLAFGAGRGVHQLAMAIEEAGFEIRDRIVELIACDTHVANFMNSLAHEQQGAFLRCIEDSTFGGELAWIFGSGFPKSHDVSKGIDKAAGNIREVVRERYTAKRIKPGAAVVAEGGYGKQDITFTATDTAPGSEESAAWQGWGTALKPALEPIIMARKPLISTVAANVLAHGTGALNIDACRIGWQSEADAAAAAAAGFASTRANGKGKQSVSIGKESRDGTNTYDPTALTGRWPANVIVDGSDEVMAAFPEAPGQSGPVTGREPSTTTRNTFGLYNEKVTAEPRGDLGSAARFFYSSKADADDRMGSKHPTVKPIDLMRYLVRLVTPPGGVVLDPFAGSGSTGVAAMLEGFDSILIEREEEYVADIERKVAFYRGDGRLAAQEKLKAKQDEHHDLPLFSNGDTPQPASQPASVSSTENFVGTDHRTDRDEAMIAGLSAPGSPPR